MFWYLNWNKLRPLAEPNGIKHLTRFASQHQRRRSRGCRRSNQMILSNVKADQGCREWRRANNIQVKSFPSLRLWADSAQQLQYSTSEQTHVAVRNPSDGKKAQSKGENVNLETLIFDLIPHRGDKVTTLQEDLTCPQSFNASLIYSFSWSCYEWQVFSVWPSILLQTNLQESLINCLNNNLIWYPLKAGFQIRKKPWNGDILLLLIKDSNPEGVFS